MYEEECLQCGGRGIIICSTCGGVGWLPMTGFRRRLAEVDPLYRKPCPTCSTGRQPFESGSGRLVCFACDGTGKKVVEEPIRIPLNSRW